MITLVFHSPVTPARRRDDGQLWRGTVRHKTGHCQTLAAYIITKFLVTAQVLPLCVPPGFLLCSEISSNLWCSHGARLIWTTRSKYESQLV